jgi:protein deglycase
MKALIPLADGCEEMEAVILIDVLRRAEWEVTSASLTGGPITASRGVRLLADAAWDDLTPLQFDALILPGGGPGAQRLRQDARVLAAVRDFDRSEKRLVALCAGPLVLQAAGVLKGRKATCYPTLADQLTAATWRSDRVVVDGHIVTSQGPGTAMDLAIELIRLHQGMSEARRIADQILLGAD